MLHRSLLLTGCLCLSAFAAPGTAPAPAWNPAQWPSADGASDAAAYQAQPYALRALEEFAALGRDLQERHRERLVAALSVSGSFEEALGAAFEASDPDERQALVAGVLDDLERIRGTAAASDFAPVVEHTLAEDHEPEFAAFVADRLHRLLARAGRGLEAEVFAQRQNAYFANNDARVLGSVRRAESIAGLARDGELSAAEIKLTAFFGGDLQPALNAPAELARAAGAVYLGYAVHGDLDAAQACETQWRQRGVSFDDDVRRAALTYIVHGELNRGQAADALEAARTAARELSDNGPLVALIERSEDPQLTTQALRALTRSDVAGWSAARRAEAVAHARNGDAEQAREACLGLPLESRGERLELAWELGQHGAYGAALAFAEGPERDVVTLWRAESEGSVEECAALRPPLEGEGLWPRVELLGHYVRTGDRSHAGVEAKGLFRTYLQERQGTDEHALRKLLRLEMTYGGGFLIELAAEELATPRERFELFLEAVEALLEAPDSELN
jgi:hypothetical protein